MESLALNSLGIEAARNRQQLGHARQGLVKRRVKADQLRQFWMTFAERLYQPQFPGAGQLKTKGLLPLATEQQQGQPA